MNKWHIEKKTELKKFKPTKDGSKIFLSSYYNGDEHGSELYEIEITIDAIGSMFLSDETIGGGFIYLYPEQVKHLKKILKIK